MTKAPGLHTGQTRMEMRMILAGLDPGMDTLEKTSLMLAKRSTTKSLMTETIL